MNEQLVPVAQWPVSMPSPSDWPAYVRAVHDIPMLSQEEESSLVKGWSEGSVDAARMLVLSHLRLVVSAVTRHSGYGLPPADLAQEGAVGLMKAIHKFRPGFGVRLSVYAGHWIDAEIKEFIFRSWRLVRLGSGKTMKKLFFGYRRSAERLAAVDGDLRPGFAQASSVAKSLGVPEADAQLVSAYFRGRDLPLLGPSDPGEAPGSGTEETLLLLDPPTGWVSPELDPLENAIVDQESGRDGEFLVRSLSALPSRDRRIIEGRFLLDPPMPLKDLSAELGVSVERVRQLEKAALRKMSAA